MEISASYLDENVIIKPLFVFIAKRLTVFGRLGQSAKRKRKVSVSRCGSVANKKVCGCLRASAVKLINLCKSV